MGRIVFTMMSSFRESPSGVTGFEVFRENERCRSQKGPGAVSRSAWSTTRLFFGSDRSFRHCTIERKRSSWKIFRTISRAATSLSAGALVGRVGASVQSVGVSRSPAYFHFSDFHSFFNKEMYDCASSSSSSSDSGSNPETPKSRASD